MTDFQWNAFCSFRSEFSQKVKEWSALNSILFPLQKELALSESSTYTVETPIVYNTDLDKITKEDEIHLIVIGDNPGKNEQKSCNQKYLVGQSGKIAEGFFRRNPELKTDFRKNVIILNKTPLHTAKTLQIKKLAKSAPKEIVNLIEESQIWMAKKTAQLHINLGKEKINAPELWLVGYAELKPKGIFTLYKETLKSSFLEKPNWENVFVFQHFSMNCFLRDLTSFRKKNPNLSLKESLHTLGRLHKEEIFMEEL